ncbi:MAG: amidohydrolase family protein [Candidatus Binatia bacterium]
MVSSVDSPTSETTARDAGPGRFDGRPRGGLLLLLAFAVGCGDPTAQLVRRPDVTVGALLIRNVGVLDVEAGVVVPARDVLVRDGRIAAVTNTGETPAAGVEIIEGGGTLLPGLIDSHGHVWSSPAPPWDLALPDVDANLRAFLYCGVTTVLDPGESDPAAITRRDRVAAGELLGPRIFTAGKFVTARGGHPVAMAEVVIPWWLSWYLLPRMAHEVASEAEARAAATAVVDSGADFMKVIVDAVPADAPRMAPEVIAAAVATARERGLRSVAHIGTFVDARDAARAGVAAWLHGVYKQRLSDTEVAELAAFDIPMAPTMTVFESYAHSLDANRVATQLEIDMVPAAVLASLNDVPDDEPMVEYFRPYLSMLGEQWPSARENARRLYEAGVTILAGSDPQTGVFSGAGLHRELAVLVAAGLPPAAVVRAATINAARFLTKQEDPDFGVVAPGKRADLLLVRGNPLQDITAISDIREVILGGVRLVREPIAR